MWPFHRRGSGTSAHVLSYSFDASLLVSGIGKLFGYVELRKQNGLQCFSSFGIRGVSQILLDFGKEALEARVTVLADAYLSICVLDEFACFGVVRPFVVLHAPMVPPCANRAGKYNSRTTEVH